MSENTKKGRSKLTEKHATGSLRSQEAQAQVLSGQKGGHRPLPHTNGKRKRPHQVSSSEEEEEEEEDDDDEEEEEEEEDDDEEGRTTVHGMIPNIRSSISCQLIIASRSHPSITSRR